VTIEAIHHVNIRALATDIAKLREFYCEIVGLRDGWRPPFESRGHWLYAGPHPVVHLVEGANGTGMGMGTGTGTGKVSEGGVDHVAFRCSDLAPMIERLRGRGIEFQLSQVPSLGDRQLLFRDPLGIGVELTMAGAAPC
jgi:catechol 2,3-dioxygenase-like lactoylglutathione lyase family enzyme